MTLRVLRWNRWLKMNLDGSNENRKHKREEISVSYVLCNFSASRNFSPQVKRKEKTWNESNLLSFSRNLRAFFFLSHVDLMPFASSDNTKLCNDAIKITQTARTKPIHSLRDSSSIRWFVINEKVFLLSIHTHTNEGFRSTCNGFWEITSEIKTVHQSPSALTWDSFSEVVWMTLEDSLMTSVSSADRLATKHQSNLHRAIIDC